MSSESSVGYADLQETKRRLNISDSITASDNKIDVNMRDADNFINAQIQLHELTPIANPDPEIVSLASSYAAALFNFWQTPIKEQNVSPLKHWEKKIQEHILAFYGKKNPTGLSGGQTFGSTTGY